MPQEIPAGDLADCLDAAPPAHGRAENGADGDLTAAQSHWDPRGPTTEAPARPGHAAGARDAAGGLLIDQSCLPRAPGGVMERQQARRDTSDVPLRMLHGRAGANDNGGRLY